MASNQVDLEQVEQLKYFLATAPTNWSPEQSIRRFMLPNGESVSCILWNNLFHITGTDIVRCMVFRFQAFNRPVKNMKKFEEGVFSDLRNLKPGIDATLEEPRSEFLEMLYKNNCIRTQKKQKVFFWYSVPHDRLFVDALERDLKREALGIESTTVSLEPNDTTMIATSPPLLSPTSMSTSTSDSSDDSNEEQTPCSVPIQTESHMYFPNNNVLIDTWISDNICNETKSYSFLEQLNDTHDIVTLSHDSLLAFGGEQTNSGTPSTQTQHSEFILTPEPSYLHVVESSKRENTEIMNETILDSPHFLLESNTFEEGNTTSPNNWKISEMETYNASLTGQMRPLLDVMNLFEGSPAYKKRRRNLVINDCTWATNEPFNSDNRGKPLENSNDGRNYECSFDMCRRRFKRFEHLTRHVRTHTGERPYLCPLEGCTKGFSRTDNLHQHLRIHYNQDNHCTNLPTKPPNSVDEDNASKLTMM